MLLSVKSKIVVLSIIVTSIATFAIAETKKTEILDSMSADGEKLVKNNCNTEGDDSKCQEGVALLEKVIRSNPKNIKALELLLDGYGIISPSNGIEIAHKRLQIDSKNGAAYFFLGIHTETPEERVKYLRNAAEYSPNNLWVHGELAWALAYNDISIPEAVREIEKQIKICPDCSDVLYRVTSELWSEGYHAEFKRVYLAFLKSDTQQRRKCNEFKHDALEKLQDQPDVVALYNEQCGQKANR